VGQERKGSGVPEKDAVHRRAESVCEEGEDDDPKQRDQVAPEEWESLLGAL